MKTKIQVVKERSGGEYSKEGMRMCCVYRKSRRGSLKPAAPSCGDQGKPPPQQYSLLWQNIYILFCCWCKAWHIVWLVKTALASCLWGVSQRPTHSSLCNSLSRTGKMALLDNWQDRGMAEWQQETKNKRQSRILETCNYAGKDMCWRQVVSVVVNFEKI